MAFPTTNLVSKWRLENGAYATDSVGANTLTTTGSTQQASGYSGYCGSGDNITVATNFGLTGTDDLSIGFWARFTSEISADGIGMLFMGSTLTTDRFIGLDYDYNGGTRRLVLYNANNSASASYTVALGTGWHYFTLVRSSGAVTVYLDRVAIISGAAQSTATGSQNAFFIGTGKAFAGSSTYYYDEVNFWSRALNATEVIDAYNSYAPLTKDLVSYWKLDEASGNAADSVGSNTLTNTNVTYSAGKINNGAVFDATSDSLSIADASQTGLDPAGDVTFSFWAKRNGAGSPAFIWKYNPTGNQRSYRLYYDNAISSFQADLSGNGTNSNAHVVVATFTAGTWYHITFTYNSTTQKGNWYLNGVALGETSGTTVTAIYNGTSAFTLGAGAGAENMDGMLDEVGVWSRALSTTEVTALYNNGLGLQYPFTNLGGGSFLLNFI